MKKLFTAAYKTNSSLLIRSFLFVFFSHGASDILLPKNAFVKHKNKDFMKLQNCINCIYNFYTALLIKKEQIVHLLVIC